MDNYKNIHENTIMKMSPYLISNLLCSNLSNFLEDNNKLYSVFNYPIFFCQLCYFLILFYRPLDLYRHNFQVVTVRNGLPNLSIFIIGRLSDKRASREGLPGVTRIFGSQRASYSIFLINFPIRIFF